MCIIIVTQLAKHRSHFSPTFPALSTLFFWCAGASRQSIDTLYQFGLSLSYNSIGNLLNNLSTLCLEEAAVVARGPHMLGYDNINISTSIHVEQRAGAPSKVQSGTIGILYTLHNANIDALHLAPLLARERACPELSFVSDIRIESK
jgi:hypothetical protein